MKAIEVLRRDQARLNAVTAPAGEPLVVDDVLLKRLANTFMLRVSGGMNFAEDLDGQSGSGSRNSECEGWANLAVADLNVWNRCHAMSLRTESAAQPYLSIANHSSLLLNKRYFPSPVWRRPEIPVDRVGTLSQ